MSHVDSASPGFGIRLRSNQVFREKPLCHNAVKGERVGCQCCELEFFTRAGVRTARV